jgi:hypothetical protein
MSNTEDWQPDQSSGEGSQAAAEESQARSAGVPSPPPAPPPPPPPPVASPAPTAPAARAANPTGYPIEVGIDAPDQIARWRPLVHWLLAIPLFIVLYVLRIVAVVCALIGWFAALFTGALPEGLGNFIAGYYRYAWRTYSYAIFLREPYPAFAPQLGYTDPGDDPAWFEVQRPQELSRVAVLLRIIFVIPQLVALFFLSIALWVAMVVAFFVVLFTGRWPAGVRNFVIGASGGICALMRGST